MANVRRFQISSYAKRELNRRAAKGASKEKSKSATKGYRFTSTLVLGCLLEFLTETQRGNRSDVRDAPLTIRTSQPIKAVYLAAKARAVELTLAHDETPVSQGEVISWCLEQHVHEATPMAPKPDIVAEFVDWAHFEHDISLRSLSTAVSALKVQGLLLLNPSLARSPDTDVEKWARRLWMDFLAARITVLFAEDLGLPVATPKQQVDTDDTGLDL